jgi:alkylated DNA nucleotide flippase Atl1
MTPRHDDDRGDRNRGDRNQSESNRVDDERADYVESVLSIVEQIPPGRATTYGAIADAVGRGGPRQVGRVLAFEGGGVPWWRVVRADGSLPPSHQAEAIARYRSEATPMKGSVADASTLRVDLGRALWVIPADLRPV